MSTKVMQMLPLRCQDGAPRDICPCIDTGLYAGKHLKKRKTGLQYKFKGTMV